MAYIRWCQGLCPLALERVGVSAGWRLEAPVTLPVAYIRWCQGLCRLALEGARVSAGGVHPSKGLVEVRLEVGRIRVL